MTGQFYKNPPRVFRSIIFLGAENLWGDFLFYWAADSRLRFALRGSADHAFFLLAGKNLAFPKYTPHPVQSNIWFRLHFWNSQKGAEQAGKAGKFVQETS